MKVLYIMVVIAVAILAMMSSPVEGSTCKYILYVVIAYLKVMQSQFKNKLQETLFQLSKMCKITFAMFGVFHSKRYRLVYSL